MVWFRCLCKDIPVITKNYGLCLLSQQESGMTRYITLLIMNIVKQNYLTDVTLRITNKLISLSPNLFLLHFGKSSVTFAIQLWQYTLEQ